MKDKAEAKAKEAEARAQAAAADVATMEGQAKALRRELDQLGPAVEKARKIAATVAA